MGKIPEQKLFPPTNSGGIDRKKVETKQLKKLQRMLAAVLPANRFYSEKIKKSNIKPEFSGLGEFFANFPFTTKHELIEDQKSHPPYGTNLTFPLNQYTRFHQTSATTGTPMRWLDTPESWFRMLDNWKFIFKMAGVGEGERIFFAFSFGPFLGFWTAFEAATRMGCLAIPGGGLSSAARLKMIVDNAATVLCCTPTYAIRLGEVAKKEGLDLNKTSVKAIIVAGEPGGSIPAVYSLIENLWPGARAFDHHGMTETGPVSYEGPNERGILRIIERGFIPEIIDPLTETPVEKGEAGELVLTNLGRWGSPLIRYRTGDLVKQKIYPQSQNTNPDMALDGGILGRVDDMVTIRGVNIYPGAIEEIVRKFEEIAEYRVEIYSERGMQEIQLEIEPVENCRSTKNLIERLQNALRVTFSLRIPVKVAPVGSLPRFEMKAKRWVKK